jgi:hypothetical protein
MIYSMVAIAVSVTIISSLNSPEKDDHNYNYIGLQAMSNNNSNNSADENHNNGNRDSPQRLDRFGIDKIYDTKVGGREWYMNMENPYADPWFILGDVHLEKQPDGSWRLGGVDIDEQFNGKYHIILGVNTPPWKQEWRDVEITGYAKIISASEDEDETEVGLQWYARGANHTDEAPCGGTSLKGRLLIDGTANWKKEIWHDGGYTDERATEQATDKSLVDRWVGWKVVMYNIANNKAVEMESYLDDGNNNNWRQVTDLVDDGRWYATSTDEEFYGAGCGLPKDYVVTNPGPVVAFRSDGILWDLKNLSVREIQPPSLVDNN